MLITLFGVVLVFAVPIVWGFLRRGVGLPMFGAPTVAEIEGGDGRRSGTAVEAETPPVGRE